MLLAALVAGAIVLGVYVPGPKTGHLSKGRRKRTFYKRSMS